MIRKGVDARSKLNHHRYSNATGGCAFETFETRVLLSADPIGAAALIIPVNFEAFAVITAALTHPQDNGDERLNRDHASEDSRHGPNLSDGDDNSGRGHEFADADRGDHEGHSGLGRQDDSPRGTTGKQDRKGEGPATFRATDADDGGPQPQRDATLGHDNASSAAQMDNSALHASVELPYDTPSAMIPASAATRQF